MRNIFLLPTDKPSRLWLYKNFDNLLTGLTVEKSKDIHPQHIYVTSDEKPKEGDWVIKISSLYKVGGIIQKYSFIDAQFEDIIFKKIILTTDPDLIADGVQAIDDEFLEWFVKNPSCESVKVERLDTFKKTNEVYVDEIAGGNYYEIIKQYKIITPQEEPKPIWKQIIEDCGGNEAFMEAAGLKPKQETSEEAAERLYPTTIDSFTDNGFDLSERERLIFINGVKWQQEQDKNKYSEEDMMEAVRFGMLYKSDSSKKLFEKKGMTPTEVLKKWFDKVKKK
jgi:hypothetical protein